MSSYSARRAIVAREIRIPLLAVVALLLAGWRLAGWPGVLPGAVLLSFLLYLFREPHRAPPAEPLAILSPVEGVVTRVECVRDPHLDRPVKRICLGSGLLDAGTLRSPAEGKVQNQWVENGAQLHCDFWIRTDEQGDVVLSLHLNRLGAAGAHTDLRIGDRVGHGQRCGFFCFGVQAAVLVPERAAIMVAPEQRVAAGHSVLAKLAPEPVPDAVDAALVAGR